MSIHAFKLNRLLRLLVSEKLLQSTINNFVMKIWKAINSKNSTKLWLKRLDHQFPDTTGQIYSRGTNRSKASIHSVRGGPAVNGIEKNCDGWGFESRSPLIQYRSDAVYRDKDGTTDFRICQSWTHCCKHSSSSLLPQAWLHRHLDK